MHVSLGILLRRSMLLASTLVLLVSFGAASAREPVFEFRNGFWRNLHHLLYAQASVHPQARGVRPIPPVASDQAHGEALTARDAAVWADAVEFYAITFAQRDLLFDDRMVALGRALSNAAPDAPLPPGEVPEDVRHVLASVADIYRDRWWSGHRAHNEHWRLALMPLLDRHGSALRGRLERLFETAWPMEPVVVDLVHYANSVGAYTSLDPVRITIATSDPHIQGTLALEILMHETAHGMVDGLRAHLAQAGDPGGRPLRRDLWHQVQFHLVGEAVAAEVDGHVPYADAIDLWSRAWSIGERRLIDAAMRPLLAGQAPLGQAVATLVSSATGPTSGAVDGLDPLETRTD